MHTRNRNFVFLVLMMWTNFGCAIKPTISPTLRPTSQPQGFNCSSIKDLPPDSAEVQTIVSDFLADFKEAYPTEYMDFFRLYAVDMFEDYVVLQGSVTQEETNVILIQKTSDKYVIVSQFLATGAHPVTRKMILDYFEKELTPELFSMIQCIDFHWLPHQEGKTFKWIMGLI